MKFFIHLFSENTMKLFSTILLLYIFALVALPCADVSNADQVKNTAISQNSHTHRHSADDLCSPFCACSCCVSSIISPEYAIQLNNCLLAPDYNSCYISSYVSSLFASIWQPPKIS